MKSPLEQIAESRGLTLQALMEAAPVAHQTAKHDAVPHGPELSRILALPSRPNPADSPQAVELAAFLTQQLARGSNPYPGALRPLQGAVLYEAWKRRAGWLPVPVGFGKTLICFLSAPILGSTRPCYVAPAGLLKQAKEEFKKYYFGWFDPVAGVKYCGWKGVHPDNWVFISYETLSREGAGVQLDDKRNVIRRALLDRLNVTSVCCDEVHKMRVPGTSVARKFRDFRKLYPHVPMLGLTGTPGNEVIHIAHLLTWCLGKENSPLPNDYNEKMAWQAATSSKGVYGPPTDIGALRLLFNEAETERARTADEDQLKDIARCAIGRKIRETPGVVGVVGGELDIPLSIAAVEPVRLDGRIDEAMAQIRTLWMTPDEDVITDATVMAAKISMLGRGYFTRWADPKPPEYWLTARKLQRAWVRDVINHNRIGIYSQEAVEKAVRRGVLNDFGLLDQRLAAEAQYLKETGLNDPIVEEVVVSDEPIQFAVQWVKEHPASIVWAYHRGFGQRLAKAIGTSCYQEEGLDANGRYVADHPKDTPMVCSYPANHTGKNLQHGWHQNLWFHAPNEQAIGRTHRPGQKRAVLNHVYIATREHAVSFWTQVGKAKEAFEMNGSAQRLLYAVNTVPPVDEWENRAGPRWQK